MPHETPAAKAVRVLGAKRIAQKCDLTTDAVWKWATQGQGRIPSKHHAPLVALAHELGVEFGASDIVGVV